MNIPGGYQCLTDIVVQDGHVLLDTGTKCQCTKFVFEPTHDKRRVSVLQ